MPCDFAPTYNAGPVGLPQDYNPAVEAGGTDGIGADEGEPWGGTTLSDSNRATQTNGSVTQRCASVCRGPIPLILDPSPGPNPKSYPAEAAPSLQSVDNTAPRSARQHHTTVRLLGHMRVFAGCRRA